MKAGIKSILQTNAWITLFFLLSFQLIGRCDTITNWQVYHNNQLLAELNSLHDIYTLTLKKSDINEDDSLMIHYFRDTPCFECASLLTVENGKHHVVYQWKGEGTFTMKKVNLGELLRSELSDFEVWYHEGEIQSRNEREFLFRIRLE